MRVLTVNAGSSSLKLRLLDSADQVVWSSDLEVSGGEATGLTSALEGLPPPDAVGHRIVHGGNVFRHAVHVDDDVVAQLEALTELAPLHQPKSLAALAAVTRRLPGVPAVACFDTAFHATIPAAAATYAIPAEWQDRWGIRRFGFHGLSHAYAARRAATLVSPERCHRMVIAHLGSGCSLAAVVAGASVDTTMGFTPLEGLVMSTRSGSVDPGLVLWLEEHEGLSPHEVADALEHRSGLLALAGTADLREVLARADAGVDRAVRALDVYLHRLVTSVGAMTAAAGGLDTLVFTGGVGEHAAVVRQRVVDRLAYLGVRLDPEANRAADSSTSDDVVSAGTGSGAEPAPQVLVIRAREDIQLAAETRAVLGSGADGRAGPRG